MQAIEFEADLQNSIIRVPSFAKINNTRVKVVLMYKKGERPKKARLKNKPDIFDKYHIDIKENTFDRNEANKR